jgi:hypothetical protein
MAEFDRLLRDAVRGYVAGWRGTSMAASGMYRSSGNG